MKKITRPFHLTNSFSGSLGEMRVAAELTRYGFRIAKPYWNDDEVDLLLLDNDPSYGFVPIPFQVKSIQVAGNTTRYIEGLKRKYVDRQRYLCLAIYDPKSDDIWVIDRAENIVAEYNANPVKGRPFDSLAPDDEVKIKFRKSPKAAFNQKWLLDKNDAIPFSKRMKDLTHAYATDSTVRDMIKALMDW
jgi:hypothetical protein